MASLAQFTHKPLDAAATAPSGFKLNATPAAPQRLPLEAISLGCHLSVLDTDELDPVLWVHVEFTRPSNKYVLSIKSGVNSIQKVAHFNLDRDFDSFKVGAGPYELATRGCLPGAVYGTGFLQGERYCCYPIPDHEVRQLAELSRISSWYATSRRPVSSLLFMTMFPLCQALTMLPGWSH